MTEHWIDVRDGETARTTLSKHGLSPADVGCIPAAAGGPKGLALLPLDRLQHAYVHEQNYLHRATTTQVAAVCRGLARAVSAGGPLQLRDDVSLSIITARARGPLSTGKRGAFARAAFSNAICRHRLSAHVERVVFQSGCPSRLATAHHGFGYTSVRLKDANREDALLASCSHRG